MMLALLGMVIAIITAAGGIIGALVSKRRARGAVTGMMTATTSSITIGMLLLLLINYFRLGVGEHQPNILETIGIVRIMAVAGTLIGAIAGAIQVKRPGRGALKGAVIAIVATIVILLLMFSDWTGET